MKFQAIIYFTVLLISFSCNLLSSESTSKNTDTLARTQIHKQGDSENEQASNTIDVANYDSLPYWNDTISQYSEAYIDTFSVNGNKFRFVSPVASHRTGTNTLRLQQLINNQWYITNLELNDNVHGGGYDHTKDINADGYNDITNDVRFTQEVYFFNPASKTFFNSSLTIINPDWTLLDTANKIFCDFQQFKGMEGEISSSLYTFRDFKRYELYHLELYNGSNGDSANLITKLILSKCASGSPDSLIKIQVTNLDKPIDTEAYNDHGLYANGTDRYFDYTRYWKQRFRKLLNYR